MAKYMMNFPRGVKADVFNPPEDFEEQIRKSFEGYTEGTNKDYTYQDKLSYIDLINKYAHGNPDSYYEARSYIIERFEYELDEYGDFTPESDYQTIETLADMYDRGQLKLYDHYGEDHHIYDKAMKLIVRAIKVVIDYE